MLYKKKKKRQRRIIVAFTTILLFISIVPLIIIMSNKNKTIATFNLAIPKIEESPPYVVCIDPGHGD